MRKTKERQKLSGMLKKQRTAVQRQITTVESLKYCGKKAIPDETMLPMKQGERGSKFFAVQTCKSRMCLCCVKRRQLEDQENADQVLFEVERAKGMTMMLTLTCSNLVKGHSIDPSKQIDVMKKSLRSVFDRKPLKRTLEQWGYIGRIHAMEVMIRPDEGRFHPHFHITLSFEKQVSPVEREKLRKQIARYWCEYIQKAGLVAVTDQQHMVVAQDASEAASYVAKGVAKELTSGTLKRGRVQGSIAFPDLIQLIMYADEEGDQEEKERLVSIYRKYEKALYRRRRFDITKSLQEWAEQRMEPTENEEVEEKKEDTKTLNVPVVIFNELVALGIEHIAPDLVFANEEIYEPFAKLCEEETAAMEKRGYSIDKSYDVEQKLRKIFDGYCDLTVWEMNKKLGLYDEKRKKKPPKTKTSPRSSRKRRRR